MPSEETHKRYWLIEKVFQFFSWLNKKLTASNEKVKRLEAMAKIMVCEKD